MPTTDNRTFIAALAKRCQCDTGEVSRLCNCLSGIIAEYCCKAASVALPAFGAFSGVKHDESVAQDPATGKTMLFPPEIRLQFCPGAMLRKKIKSEKK